MQRGRSLYKEIKKHFGDNAWHSIEKIAAKLNADRDHVFGTLRTMHWNQAYPGCRVEKRQAGTTTEWKITPTEGAIPITVIKQEIVPLVDALIVEGRKSMATMSPHTVASLAGKLRKLLATYGAQSATRAETRARRQAAAYRKALTEDGHECSIHVARDGCIVPGTERIVPGISPGEIGDGGTDPRASQAPSRPEGVADRSAGDESSD
jgi:hypothetical protein